MIGELFNRIFDQAALLIIEKNNGEYRITKKAMADIINNSIADISGLKSYKWEMRQEKDAVKVILDCQLEDDASTGEIADSIRNKLKYDLEQWVGIQIKEVKILT